jgi:hypothetical protein
MPNIGRRDFFSNLGVKKIWQIKTPSGDFATPTERLTFDQYADNLGTRNIVRQVLKKENFVFQLMNCFIIAVIILQSEIFNSSGYLKFVTQSNGSMDLLMQLAETKGKCITYLKNNLKIRKILAV